MLCLTQEAIISSHDKSMWCGERHRVILASKHLTSTVEKWSTKYCIHTKMCVATTACNLRTRRFAQRTSGTHHLQQSHALHRLKEHAIIQTIQTQPQNTCAFYVCPSICVHFMVFSYILKLYSLLFTKYLFK